jgi:signal transduction histidine kinase
VERIISGTDIDSVLNEIVNLLISPLNFKFAGMFILNEILLELRGLVFARRGTPEDTSSLQFRSKKVRISKKSPLSDVMYFNRPGLISLDSIEDWKNMDEYMSGEVLACPLIGSDGKPVGIVIAGAEDYERKNTAMLRLYSHIASLAMSNRNMRDELERLKNYEDDFDKVDYVSKDLVKMGMLAATVAHELKNPLVAIGGFAKRLAGFCADPRMDNYIKMIQSEVSRLENLVTEILDYSKNVDLKIEKLHLDKVVSDTLRLMAESLSVGMIHVSKTIEPDILVYVDKNRFTQVLINIIINAVQVMPSGGDLKIYSEEGPETTILYIKDTGGGVPQEEMDKIFEPFHSSKQDGTGLGLSLCKKIINAHGGHISVTNDDTGAVFSLILPRAGGFDV